MTSKGTPKSEEHKRKLSEANRGKHDNLRQLVNTREWKQANSIRMQDWWTKNRNSEKAKRMLSGLEPRQHFWDDKKKAVAIIHQRKIEHDKVLDQRIAELESQGAKIIVTDYALKAKRRKIPDVLYYLNGELVGEDVKYNGLIFVDGKWKI